MIADDLTGYATFNQQTQKFFWTDTLNYAAQTGTPSPQLGTVTAIGPTGSAFPSVAVEIDLSAAETESGEYQLPKTNGLISPGGYVFTYEVEVDYAITGLNILAITNLLNGNYIEVSGNYSFIPVGATVTISSSTAGNDGAKTVGAQGAVYNSGTGRTRIYPTQTMITEGDTTVVAAYSGTITYEKAFSYNYTACTEVTPVITSDFDCDANTGVVTDETVIGTQEVVTRLLSLTYPVGLSPAPPSNPKTTTNSVLTISPIAQGIFQAELTLNMQLTQDDDLVVVYEVSTSEVITVTCSTGLCDIEACCANMMNAYKAQLDKGLTPANQNQVVAVNGYYALWNIAKGCGDNSAMQTYATAITEILGEECDCTPVVSSTPSWVGDYNAIVYPAWTWNSYVPVWVAPQQFTSADTVILEESENIAVGKELMANIGDTIVVEVDGFATGNIQISIGNTTTGVFFITESGTTTTAASFHARLELTRVDGDLCSWKSLVTLISNAGVVTDTYDNAEGIADGFDFESENIFDIGPSSNSTLNSAKLYVLRKTTLPE